MSALLRSRLWECNRSALSIVHDCRFDLKIGNLAKEIVVAYRGVMGAAANAQTSNMDPAKDPPTTCYEIIIAHIISRPRNTFAKFFRKFTSPSSKKHAPNSKNLETPLSATMLHRPRFPRSSPTLFRPFKISSGLFRPCLHTPRYLATGNQRAILIQTKPDPNPNPQKTQKKKKQKKDPRHRSIPSQRHMHNGIYQNISTPKQKILLDSPDAN
jgi:hypothetical protein